MSDRDWRIFMERVIVLIHGICGFISGVCMGILIMVLCAMNDIIPQTIIGEYFLLFWQDFILGIIGFWLSVRNDWWRMKRDF